MEDVRFWSDLEKEFFSKVHSKYKKVVSVTSQSLRYLSEFILILVISYYTIMIVFGFAMPGVEQSYDYLTFLLFVVVIFFLRPEYKMSIMHLRKNKSNKNKILTDTFRLIDEEAYYDESYDQSVREEELANLGLFNPSLSSFSSHRLVNLMGVSCEDVVIKIPNSGEGSDTTLFKGTVSTIPLKTFCEAPNGLNMIIRYKNTRTNYISIEHNKMSLGHPYLDDNYIITTNDKHSSFVLFDARRTELLRKALEDKNLTLVISNGILYILRQRKEELFDIYHKDNFNFNYIKSELEYVLDSNVIAGKIFNRY